MRSPFAPVVLSMLALGSSLVRWCLQESHNVYTAFEKRFYVPDPDLGWRISAQHPIWLGLDACAVITTIAVCLVVAGFVIRRRENARGARATILRATSWVIAVLPLFVPTAAFASGLGPLHGRDTLPAAAAVLIENGIDGALDAPTTRYTVVPHAGTSITA